MTKSAVMPRRVHSGTVGGTRGPFAVSRDSVNIPFRSSADLIVRRKSAAGAYTTLVYPTDYTITGTADTNGWIQSGSITLTASQALVYDDERVDIRRSVERTQATAFAQAGAFPSVATELMADRSVVYSQDLAALFEEIQADGLATVITEEFTLGNMTLGYAEFTADGTAGPFTLANLVIPSVYACAVAVGGTAQLNGFTLTVDGTDTDIQFTAPYPPNGTLVQVISRSVTGLQGPSGRTILSGTAAPTTEGTDGDFYIRTSTSMLYGPKSGTWPAGVSLIGSPGTDGTDGQGVPTGGTTAQVLRKTSGADYATEWATPATAGLPRSYLAGLGMANNATDATNDIDISPGTCRDSTNAADITCSALTKRLDAAWAVGSAAGGLDTGSIANTTYHCFAIKKDSDGVGDFLFSTSATSPTMPSGYTYFRRIGSIVRASAAIKAFKQNGDVFQWITPALDFSAVTTVTTSVTRTLTAPLGVSTIAFGEASVNNAGTCLFYIRDLSITDTDPATAANPSTARGTSTYGGGYFQVRTDTSAQVGTRASNGGVDVRINTFGYIDTRGKDA